MNFGLRLLGRFLHEPGGGLIRLKAAPFQYANAIGIDRQIDLLGFTDITCALALGKSTFTEWLSRGAVTMKITNSTSITSISGTMLISASGAPPRFCHQNWQRP